MTKELRRMWAEGVPILPGDVAEKDFDETEAGNVEVARRVIRASGEIVELPLPPRRRDVDTPLRTDVPMPESL